MLIYKVTNKINGHGYIGQTIKSLNIRKQAHINSALRKENNYYFCHAIRKYGPENFTWEIIAEGICLPEMLDKLEKHFIQLYHTFEKGYNMTFGGGSISGFKHSKESKRKMSETHKGKNNYE